jgi:hypothetical protein
VSGSMIIQFLKYLIHLMAILFYLNIVTCRPIARERVDKHASMETGSWNHLVTEHVSVDTSGQQTFPWIRIRNIREQN